ncbi:hypothetical protein ACHAXS_004073 [Conticribra weissflogii]
MSSTRNSKDDNIDEKLHCDELKRACDAASAEAAAPSGGLSSDEVFAARGGRDGLQEEEPTMNYCCVLHAEPMLKRAKAPCLSNHPTMLDSGYSCNQLEVLCSDPPKPIISSSKPLAKRWVVSKKVLTPCPTDIPLLKKISCIVPRVSTLDLVVLINDCLQRHSVKSCKVQKHRICQNLHPSLLRAGGILGKAVSKPDKEKPLLSFPISHMEFVKDTTLPAFTFEGV